MFKVTKDPGATLDYAIDWSQWLGDDDSISSASASADDGISVDSDDMAGNHHVIWLSGGQARRIYTVTSRIVTAGGRIDDRSIQVYVVDR